MAPSFSSSALRRVGDDVESRPSPSPSPPPPPNRPRGGSTKVVYAFDVADSDPSDEDGGFERRPPPMTAAQRGRGRGWNQLLPSFYYLGASSGRHGRRVKSAGGGGPYAPLFAGERESGRRPPQPLRPSRRRRALFLLAYLVGAYFMLLGAIQTMGEVVMAISGIWPDEVQWVIDHWGQGSTELLSHWPTDRLGDVRPVACHSHNDEWRQVPLYSAVHAGCTSVEADVFAVEGELLVGHSLSALTRERTLKALYLDSLIDMVRGQNPAASVEQRRGGALNGLFDTDPSQTLVFMVDFKNNERELWPLLVEQLTPMRDLGYLTYFNGTGIVERPVTVVASGSAPFDLITANATYRDIFYDAPLDQLADFSREWENPVRVDEGDRDENNAYVFSPHVAGLRPPPLLDEAKPVGDGDEEVAMDLNITDSPYNAFNSYYGSVSFTRSVGLIWGSRVSARQLQLVRAQVRGAHRRGLRVRYWGLPYWPAGLRNHVWHVLMREGVDVLSVDDLVGAAKRDWRKCKGWFC